ncbi:hypothetical protein NDU88_002133 [Pleurodeles waltl]|uniref:Uncharacterized protein n=1 Tax=Pleurodeles waltl TaxID=8319 RepID=A0AAV7PEG6_PLEWA|nr:hypothetical protein NDU88_002133 [Pleurodeles waltl]
MQELAVEFHKDTLPTALQSLEECIRKDSTAACRDLLCAGEPPDHFTGAFPTTQNTSWFASASREGEATTTARKATTTCKCSTPIAEAGTTSFPDIPTAAGACCRRTPGGSKKAEIEDRAFCHAASTEPGRTGKFVWALMKAPVFH